MEKLPSEITTNILSRLPFKSTGQCKCVSKQWNCILSDPKFLKTQLTQLSKLTPDLLLFYKSPKSIKFGLCYIEDDEQEEESPFPKKRITPFKKYDHQFIPVAPFRCPAILGSCNGFLCVSDQYMFDTSRLPRNPIYVANPITGERSSLPHYKPPKQSSASDMFLSGFVYNECKDEFKLVLVLFTPRNSSNTPVFKNEVQVCALGSGVWSRKVGVVPDDLASAGRNLSNVYVNECLHWVTIDASQSLSNTELLAFVSFSVELEKFAFVPTPSSALVRLSYPYATSCELGVLEKKLSLVKCMSDGCIQIFVMEKYGVKESWAKKFSIEQELFTGRDDMENCDVQLIKFCKKGELILLCGNEVLVSYNTKTQKCRVVKVEGVKKKKGRFIVVHPFVGRLCSLKSAFGMESAPMESSIESDE